MLDAASEGEERFPIAGNWTKESKLSNSRFRLLTKNLCILFLRMVCPNRRFCLSLSPFSVCLSLFSLSLSLSLSLKKVNPNPDSLQKRHHASNFIKEFRGNTSSRIVFSSVRQSCGSFSLREIFGEVLSAYLENLWLVRSSFAGARGSEGSPLCFFLSF